MLANSWLYHYYSVQSKIQFGLPFEGPTRIPPTPPYYHHHHPHHHSPTIPPNLAHGYPPHPHHVPYGYHSPVGLAPPPPPHQTSPSHIMGHYNGTNGNNGMVGPYAYRIEVQQPVDYSQTTTTAIITTNSPQIEPRCSSTNSSNSSSNRLGSPPPKRRILSKIEPLYIAENSQTSENIAIETEPPQFYQTGGNNGNSVGGGGVGGGGGIGGDNENGCVIYDTIIPTRPRIITKAPPPDPPDFIDIWNPSPPWSEGAQKVPDISQQELSPYLTTTPPTPTSAPPSVQSIGPAFSFDWMSEQFVPIMDYGHCVPCVTQDGISVQVPVQLSHHWPPDPRLIPLQASHTNSQNNSTNIPGVIDVKSNDSDDNNSKAPSL